MRLPIILLYADWVSFYLREEVLELVRQMRESFDTMAAQASPGPALRRRLAEIFMTSSRLEGAFWDMAYTVAQWPDLSGGHPRAARRLR